MTNCSLRLWRQAVYQRTITIQHLVGCTATAPRYAWRSDHREYIPCIHGQDRLTKWRHGYLTCECNIYVGLYLHHLCIFRAPCLHIYTTIDTAIITRHVTPSRINHAIIYSRLTTCVLNEHWGFAMEKARKLTRVDHAPGPWCRYFA